MKRFAVIVLVLAACSAPPPPAPAPSPQPEEPGVEKAIGTVRVTATTLNVRREASASSEVVGQVRKGDKLALLAAGDQWHRVRLANGSIGFVSVDHVVREGASRRGCAADADFSFAKTPTPDLREGSAHGIVTVDANVDAKGNVTSTKVTSNTTGDPSLGSVAEKEIRSAKFVAPIRNCVAKAFIFTYKRAF